MYPIRWMAELTRAGSIKDRDDFERLLAERFPAIAAEIGDVERGLLHLEMAVLARATCRAVDLGDLRQVQAHIGFVDELFSDAGPDLENAVYVSYLENVFIRAEDRRYTLARTMLSNRLQTALTKLEEHWRKIAEWKGRPDCG
jgi:hypothetical protein